MSHNILVRFWHFPVVTLGPGRRLGIWLQGCSIHCKGCIAPENQPFDEAFSIPVNELICNLESAFSEADGVTISGGEPLDQTDAVEFLLSELNRRGIRDILLYSGYSKHTALKKLSTLPDLIAALVDGPFIEGDVTSSAWKGSANQKLTIFRDEYREVYEQWSTIEERNVQLIRKNAEYYLIGIPRQNDLLTLRT